VLRITLWQPHGGPNYVFRKNNVEDVDKYVRKFSYCNVMHVTKSVRYCTVIHARISSAPV
jgi:hypothetical protein